MQFHCNYSKFEINIALLYKEENIVTMKKFSLITVLFMCVCTMTSYAQNQSSVSFFDANGTVRPETVELKKDSIITISHRTDDVVWSRVVYRIIDMRYKQNYQLYFPIKTSDSEYKNLFKLMLDAIVDGMPVYKKTIDDIKPTYADRMTNLEITDALVTTDPTADGFDFNRAISGDYLLNYDSLTQELKFNAYSFEPYIRNQIKFVIQEAIFFNKHTSRLYSKIIGIAPIYAGLAKPGSETNIMLFLQQSLLFWVAFDEFRPYLATQMVIPNRNDKTGLTFDNFFIQKMYFSYLLGDTNLFGRMLVDERNNLEESEVRSEQERIETELLNFEQDLWEY